MKKGIMPAEVAEPAPKSNAPEIPDKLYFRIGEVSRLAGIKPYVLRFWETEFPGLGPKKSGTGHRLYRRKDVEMVFQIKHLLYDKRYTIEGARKDLDTRHKTEQLKPTEVKSGRKKVVQGDLFANTIVLDEIRKELVDILEILG